MTCRQPRQAGQPLAQSAPFNSPLVVASRAPITAISRPTASPTEALRGHLAIPKDFAATKRLENGRTAEETFAATLAELAAKVDQLRDDLAGQDAQAFLSHSRVALRRFARAQSDGDT